MEAGIDRIQDKPRESKNNTTSFRFPLVEDTDSTMLTPLQRDVMSNSTADIV
jgi:hypothetical protein